MKITKLIHACILIEEDGLKILIDPGDFSWRSDRFRVFIDGLESLDYVVYTHSHYDHFSEDIAKLIKDKFKNIQFMGDEETSEKLKKLNIDCSTESNDTIELIYSKHEQFFPGTTMCKHLHVKIFNKLLHTGDSMGGIKEAEITALPIYGPWEKGTIYDFLDLAIKLKPGYILPIHDWMLTHEWINEIYPRLKDFLEPHGIKFLAINNFEEIEIQEDNHANQSKI